MAFQEVGHRAGEKFHVGAAHADPLDVDDHVTAIGCRRLNVDNAGLLWTADHECPHGDIMADIVATHRDHDERG